jgi:2-phospho-L-lactate guanylyltransferase
MEPHRMGGSRTAASSRSVVALVPLRTGGKSRLGVALTPADRDALVLAMLDDVVAALSGAGIDDVRVLAGDRTAAGAAAARGLPAVLDPTAADGTAADPTNAGPGGATGGRADVSLRSAVDAALAQLPRTSTRLVVAADLPRLCAAEVAAVLADPAQVVVAPTTGGGTAVLRLAPGVSLTTRYGPGSAGAHLTAADEAGWSTAMLDLPGARHDVDAASDLSALEGPLDGTSPGPVTAAFLAGLHG